MRQACFSGFAKLAAKLAKIGFGAVNPKDQSYQFANPRSAAAAW
jgi:hypothetical protein